MKKAILQQIEQRAMRPEPIGDGFRVGDSVRVHTILKEGDKERVQIFEGVVIARKRGGINASFTVRKMSYGVGVERVFPVNSRRIEKVDLVQKGRVRQGRLFYLRALQGKAARIRSERTNLTETNAPAGGSTAAPAEAQTPEAAPSS